ncbi:hypothetical protein J6590_043079 [Homalodisca vitripennis]|nr:hypothetical protein J6590_043079 [Homalodisca vitripennis]
MSGSLLGRLRSPVSHLASSTSAAVAAQNGEVTLGDMRASFVRPQDYHPDVPGDVWANCYSLLLITLWSINNISLSPVSVAPQSCRVLVYAAQACLQPCSAVFRYFMAAVNRRTVMLYRPIS